MFVSFTWSEMILSQRWSQMWTKVEHNGSNKNNILKDWSHFLNHLTERRLNKRRGFIYSEKNSESTLSLKRQASWRVWTSWYECEHCASCFDQIKWVSVPCVIWCNFFRGCNRLSSGGLSVFVFSKASDWLSKRLLPIICHLVPAVGKCFLCGNVDFMIKIFALWWELQV